MWMPEEFGAVTQAYGRILGQPCPDWMTAAAPVIRYVPPQIRQTGGPAIQGARRSNGAWQPTSSSGSSAADELQAGVAIASQAVAPSPAHLRPGSLNRQGWGVVLRPG